jgi:hypothetical protein
MSTETMTPYRPAPSPAPAQPVNLTDRIAWQWYLLAAALPVLGALIAAVAGIVFMARSKIGPALALWATCGLAMSFWAGVGALAVIAKGSESADIAESMRLTTDPAAQTNAAIQTDKTQPPVADEAAEQTDGASQAAPTPATRRTSTSTKLASCGNLQVRAATTTCSFAQNVFWEYWTAAQRGDASNISAYSAGAGRNLDVTCTSGGQTVVCATDADGEIRIPASALAAYTQSMADRYAASHNVGA